MRSIVLVVHNVRSAHNVGSLLRTADGLGIDKVYLTGYTPYPSTKDDNRLPHISQKLDRQINKTALGAEKSVDWSHHEEILDPASKTRSSAIRLPTAPLGFWGGAGLFSRLRNDGYQIVALEQTKQAIPLARFKPKRKIALIIGSEIGGLDESVLQAVDKIIQIPMRGKKESFNVSVAAAIAMYKLAN